MATIHEFDERGQRLLTDTEQWQSEVRGPIIALADSYNALFGELFAAIDEYWSCGSFPSAELPLEPTIELVEKLIAKSQMLITVGLTEPSLSDKHHSTGFVRLAEKIARARRLLVESREPQDAPNTPDNDALLKIATTRQPPATWHAQPEENLF